MSLQCSRPLPKLIIWLNQQECYLFLLTQQWQPTPVLLPRKSHGRRSLVGYTPWGSKESDTTERLHSFLFYFLLVLDTFISLSSSTYWAGGAYTCVFTSFRLMFNTEYFVREPGFFWQGLSGGNSLVSNGYFTTWIADSPRWTDIRIPVFLQRPWFDLYIKEISLG